MTTSAVFLGACTGNAGKDGKAVSSQAGSARPISIQEYGSTVRGIFEPLESALKELGKGKGYKGLTGRITAAQDAARQAASRLSQVSPPSQIAREHSQLVAVLPQFHNELDGLSAKARDRELCSGATVLTGLDSADTTSALRNALAAVNAKMSGEQLVLTVPTAGRGSSPRPANGKFIRSGNRSGRAQLIIANGGSDDAVVTLIRGSKPAVSVYVREGKKYTVTGVADGRYGIFFTGGSAWDDKARAFGRDCAFQRFEDPLNYRTVRTATQIRWQTWRITLNKVVGGNARTSEVDPNDFPEG
jgi:hypothetical protein